MNKLKQIFSVHKFTLSWLLLVILGGVFGGFIAAALLCLPLIFIKNEVLKIETLFVLFILIFFLGDNFEGPLSFAQNLRFVILGIGLLLLVKYKLFKANVAKYIIPFSLLATAITYALSPLGIEATARGLSYLLVALVVFKCVQLLVAFNAKRFYTLLLTILFLYFCFNVVLLLVPLLGANYISGRYTGLMANPNGLGMVAMFSYALIDILRRKQQVDFGRQFFMIFKGLLIVLVILTGSRTGLFSIVIYEMSIRLLKHKLLLGIALLGVCLVYVISDSLNTAELVESLGLSSYLRIESLEDASGRTEVWAVAVEEIQQQPWLGKGMLYDNYFIDFYADRFIGENRARHWYGIWNSYLSLLLNVGLIGILAFAFFWYKLYALSHMKIVRFAFLMMCLFSAITESWMAASMNAFMPLVFSCWALQIYQTKPNNAVL